MLETIQSALLLIFGLVLILLLLLVLKYVHEQAKRVKYLENEMRSYESTEEITEKENK